MMLMGLFPLLHLLLTKGKSFPFLLPFVILASRSIKKNATSHLPKLCLSMRAQQDSKISRALKVESVQEPKGCRSQPWFTVPVILGSIQPAEFDELPCACGLLVI